MNLVPLFEEALEFQNYNGTVLSNGKVAVFYIGRTRLADIFNDIEGLSPAENPRVLDNLGMGPIYVNPAFDYEMVVYDAYDNELFSVKKYVLSKGEHSTANVVVTPSEHIAVSAWTIGDVQVYMPYLVGEVGKVYEGIDPIVVNNDVNRISANHIPLGVQDPLYFVEDSETACIIGCSAQTEIPAELSGKWDEASDAVIANSAQWAEGTEYEAGSYVDIDGHTISITGLQPEGDYAYNSALSSKLDVTALPQDLVHSGDLTAYQPVGDYQTAGNYLSATDSANFYPIDNPSGFITGVDLTDYATTAQLDEKLDKTDSGNFYPMEGNPSGFLTAHQSLQGYATEQWVEDKGYLTSVEIPESATWNATTETVSSNSAQWGASNPQIPVTGINGIKISESGDKVVFEVSANYATEDWVTGQGYLTAETDWTNTITAASANAYAEATAAIPTGLATTGDLQTVSGEITALIPSTAGLATESFVTSQGYITNDAITGKQDITGMTAYATVESLTAKQDVGDYLSASDSANFLLTSDSGNFYPSDNPSAFITGVDLTPYQTTADMVNYQTTAGMTAYMTTTDSANFYTTANESGYLTAVPDTYLQNTDLSTEDGKVTAISGIPLSAGGDVPEGVMVESAVGYNAVNEISGYNGSAIAQYGAEKQWLVHDDTLVHAANSAQYALGVNVSAVQTLMGLDETVLYTGNTGVTAFTASEPFTNFREVAFYVSPNTSLPAAKVVIPMVGYNTSAFALTYHSIWAGFKGGIQISTEYNNTGMSSFELISGAWFGWAADKATTGTYYDACIYKIIGIGRKA